MNELQKKFEKEIDELARASNRIASLGYVTSHGGNVSYRAAENVIVITPTKVPKADVKFDDVCLIDLKGNILFASEGRKPTGEWPFHVDILNKRTDLNALIHAHPPYLTGLAIAHDDTLSKPLLPEPVTEVGPVLHVPYAEPLSQELADAFDPLLYKTNAWLMLNHGVLIGSYEGIWRGTELLELIEATAQSVAIAATVGEIKTLSREEVKKLDNVNLKRNLPFPGGPKGGAKSLTDVFFN